MACTCVYNQSEKCKHVAAVIEYVNNEKSLSKTSYEQVWGRPSEKKQILEEYAKGSYFCDMYPPKASPNVRPQGVHLSELKSPSALKTVMVEAAKDEHEESIKRDMQLKLRAAHLILMKEECDTCVKTFFVSCKKYKLYSVAQVVPTELKDFYEDSIVLSQKQILELACDTLEQSKCEKWFNARYLRISASKNAYSIKSRKKKTVESLVGDMLFPNKFDVHATKYGRLHEPDARKAYEKLFDVQVKSVGVIVSQDQP